MSEKVLELARDEILQTIQKAYPDITLVEAQGLSDELLNSIDWSNSALMHKSISWITNFYLQNQVLRQKV